MIGYFAPPQIGGVAFGVARTASAFDAGASCDVKQGATDMFFKRTLRIADALGLGKETTVSYQFGEWELRCDPLLIERNGVAVELQRQPLTLLKGLIERHGSLLTHEAIRALLWPNVRVNFAEGTHVCIRQIRVVLGDDGTLVESVAGVGYRFTGSIREKRVKPAVDWGDAVRRRAPAGVLAAGLVCGLLFLIDQPVVTPSGTYLKAAYLLRQSGDEAARRSLILFEQAAVENPRFTPTYVGAAEAHVRLGDLQSAREMALIALSNGSRDARPHLILGRSAMMGWDWISAERHFRSALSRDDSNAEAHHGLATIALLRGNVEGVGRHMSAAYRLDPGATLLLADFGWMELALGRSGRAAELCGEALRLEPEALDARICLMRSLRSLGDDAGVAAQVAAIMTRSGASPEEIAAVLSGQDAAVAFERWRLADYEAPGRTDRASPTLLANLHAFVGEHEEAMDLLERALLDRDPILPLMLSSHAFAVLRDDDRFMKVAAACGFVIG